MSVEEVQYTKEYKRFLKQSSEKEAQEMLKKTDADLDKLISTNAIHEKEVDAQMKENSAYRKAVQTKKDFEGAKRDRLKITKTSIALAVLIMHERKRALRQEEAV